MNISLLIVLCLGLSVTLVHATTLRSGILIEKDNTAFQYNLIKETVGSFKEASEMCGFAYEGGVLAVVDNREKYDFIVDLVEETDINFYFGLKRQTIPESFSFTDNINDTNKTFFETSFQFPWAVDQPNNDVVDSGNGICVLWSENGWSTVDCNDNNFVVCRKECTGDSVATCINNEFEVVLVSGEFNFVDALRVCQISGDQVARVSSLEAFTGIENFLIRKNFPPVYIGLIRLEEFVTIDPLSFSFTVEENENKTFFQTRGELPWASCNELQPNDDLNNDEACVEWQLNNQELGSKNLWNDINCESIGLRALCQVQAVIDDGIDDRNNETKGASNLFFVLSVTFFLFLLLLAIQIIIYVQQKKLKQIEMY